MRYLPLTDSDRQKMLADIGVKSVEGLYADVPEKAKTDKINLPLHKGEMQVEKELSAVSAKNMKAGAVPCFLGAGAYRHYIPAVVDHLVQRSEFLTAYTPYQPEVSQGTLQALFEFQTQVAMITEMEVANASMYDCATACAEAVSMACRVTRRKKAVLSGNLHPHYIDVTKDFTQFTGIECDVLSPVISGEEELLGKIDSTTACVVVQTPDFFGQLKDFSELAEACHAQKALLIIAIAEPLSLGLVKTPGEMDADIVVCEGQSLAGGLNFGGPGVGLFAAKKKYVRQMPGRLAGETVDADGKRGWVLTLSTREQHIRREKATSNICTNSGLMALSFSIHMSLLGDKGFTRLAEINHENTVKLADRLSEVEGIKVLPSAFFNEVAVLLSVPAKECVEAMAQRRILGGVPASRFYPENADLQNVMLIAATETCSAEDIEKLVTAIADINAGGAL